MLSRIHPSYTVIAEWNARRKEAEKVSGTPSNSVVGMEGTSKDEVGIILARHVRVKLWRGLNVKQTKIKVSRINTLNTRGPLMFLRGSVAGVPWGWAAPAVLNSLGVLALPYEQRAWALPPGSTTPPELATHVAGGIFSDSLLLRFTRLPVVTLCCFYIDADAWESCGLERFILHLSIWVFVGIPWFGGGSCDVW